MRRYLALLISVFIFVLAVAIVNAASVNSSPLGRFNATPVDPSINWSNSYVTNITLGIINATNDLTLTINNGTNTVRANYSQSVASQGTVCGSGDTHGIRILVQNTTDATYTNNITIANASIANITLYPNQDCPAGKYYGQINVTNSSEFILLNLTFNIPINTSSTTGIGIFDGSLAANAAYYHSYFFNTSALENATGVYFNFSWSNSSTADPDIFLLDDSGTVLVRGISKTGNESLFNSYMTPNKMYEIRIYGNSTSAISYSNSGQITLSTLNVTNATDGAQLAEINYGTLNITNSTNNTNVMIKNMGSINYSSVSQSMELYKIDRIDSSGNKNFTVISPGSSIATKIHAAINYTGGSNYTIKLYKPDGTLSDSSYSKRANANMTGIQVEDYVESSNTDAGKWRIEINDSNAVSASYTLTIKTYVNASKYFTTNYTAAGINSTGFVGRNATYHINLTIPNATMSGLHEGTFKYTDGRGEVAKLAVKVNVSAPMLVVNDTVSSGTYTFTDNIGFERTQAGGVNISINNSGTKDLVILNNQNSTYLYLTSNSSKVIIFNFSYPSTVSAGTSGNITMNYTINTSNTTNTSGLYVGWILFNTSDAAPYNTFNLTVRVNLTSDIDVSFDRIENNYLSNSSKSYNVTTWSKIYYINDSATEISPRIANVTNFTAYIKSDNVTSYRYPTTGSLDVSNYTTTLYVGTDGYKVNVTVPSGLPGGNYTMYLGVTYNGNVVTLTGEGSNNTLYINNTGLYLDENSSALSLDAEEVGYFNVSIINYGNVKSTGTLSVSSSDTGAATVSTYSIDKHGSSSDGECGSHTAGSSSFTLDVDSLAGETCIFTVKVTAKNITNDDSTVITFTPSNAHYGTLTTTVNVDGDDSSDDDSSSSSDDAAASDDSTPTPSNEYEMKLLVPDKVEIVQGDSRVTSVDVENTGDSDITDVSLSISGINSSWYSVTPDSYDTIKTETTKTFTVTYNIPADALVKDYIISITADGTDSSANDTMTLRVLPNNDTKNSTALSMENLSAYLKSLEDKINDLKNDTVKTKYNSIKSKLDEARQLADSGDYFGAIQKINEIETDIDQLNELIKGAESVGTESTKAKIAYVVFGAIGVLAVGFLAYLLVPPKEGYHPDKGFKYVAPEQKRKYDATRSTVSSLLDRLKSLFKKKSI